MIIVKLSGGLGNQLFQYAYGRHLASINQLELKLDTSALTKTADWTNRSYALDAFTIQAEEATPDEIKALAGSPHGLLQRVARKAGIMPIRYFQEPHFHFYPSALCLKGNHYLEGYWQSEKYFEAISPMLRQELSFTFSPSSHSQTIKEKISGCTSVSIHLRRSDYVKTSKANLYLQPLPMNYYQQAIDSIRQRVENPAFFVFSEDIEWAKNQGVFASAAHFSTGTSAPEDLWLMSHCHHHIIANSTFSWWGAWLNQRPDKTVIAPQKWFSTERFDTGDLLPVSWIQL